MGLAHTSVDAAGRSGAARARCRAPPTTSAAASRARTAAAESPARPSSPIPTMASQGAAAPRATLDRRSSPVDKAVVMRILVLGGTAEAYDLVCALSRRPGSAVTLSLAGRTSRPREAPAPAVTRSGGFGGTDGLAAWLRAEGCDLLVDATHPFAAIISRNAAT